MSQLTAHPFLTDPRQLRAISAVPARATVMRRYPRASARTRRTHTPWQNLGRHVPVGCVAVGRKQTPLLQSSSLTQEEPSAREAPHTLFKQAPVAPHITSSVQTLPEETTGMQALSSPRQYCPAGQVVAWQGGTPQIWPLQYPLSQKKSPSHTPPFAVAPTKTDTHGSVGSAGAANSAPQAADWIRLRHCSAALASKRMIPYWTRPGPPLSRDDIFCRQLASLPW